jgi:Icc-related predicted phosphoesterase
MKLHILADLHIEFDEFRVPQTDADVVLLAGDIHVGDKGFHWARDHFPDRDVVYVLGNHEYYRGAVPKLTQKLERLSAGSNIHVLDNRALTLGDVRILGCTLWSDFKLLNNLDIAVIAAQDIMNDFRLIRVSPAFRKLLPADTAKMHRKSRTWLKGELRRAKTENKKTVVITHNAPSLRSVPARYKTDPLSAAFASNMEDLIFEAGPDLWVHGHIHDSSDYRIGNTRVICNPRGYAHEPNPDFDADLVVEI